jgi:hypothetical protein
MRNAQARSDKLEALLEKRKVQMRCDTLEAKVKMDERDAQARCDKLEAALENEKKDRLVQQQIDQLKWEARPAGQIPQLAYGSAPPPASSYILQNTPAVNPPAVLLPAKPLPTSPPFQHTPPQPKSTPKPIVSTGSAAHTVEMQKGVEADNLSSQSAPTALLPPAEDSAVAHMLSVSAFDAAIDLARSGKLLPSEALSVRGRAAAGKREVGGGGLHWDEEVGRPRLAKMMGRMQGPREALERALWVYFETKLSKCGAVQAGFW